MDPTERFAALVGLPDPDIPLDEAALLIAAHAHPELDLAEPLGALDELARDFDGDDAGALATYLFVERGFSGNAVDYGDPRNSYLDDVLTRRLGIPITLSVVMMEVGRRAGVGLRGVGMPGHFLVAPEGEEAVWFDPFHGGHRLDAEGCAALFADTFGPGRTLGAEDLAPVRTIRILDRMLANLQSSLGRRDPVSLQWVLRLRLRIPDLAAADRAAVTALLARAN